MTEFKINFNGVKFIESKLKLFDKSDLKNKKYNHNQYLEIKKTVERDYILPKDAQCIKDSYDFVTPIGDIYKEKGKTGLYIKTKYHKVHGYLYCGIKYKDGRVITKRVHRIVAETFLENPNNNPHINHIDGDKTNNSVNNLEWCTPSENMIHASDNKLFVNDKGYEDSQSKPVNMYNLNGDIISSYGSITIASKETGIPKNTIARHCKECIIPRKHKVYFRYQNKL